MRLSRRLLLVALAVLGACYLAAGCGAERDESAAARIDLPTRMAPDKDIPLAQLTGAVRWDQATGCVWLSATREESTDKVSAVWPAGFTARGNPLRIHDPDGALVAREGDVVTTTGGYIAESSEIAVPELDGCRVSRDVWLVGKVEEVRSER